MDKVVAIHSGGMDSTVLLYQLRAEGYNVSALSVDYGQRHRRELESAKAICVMLGVRHEVIDLTAVTRLLGGSALTDASVEVPEGHYEQETMKATVVPNRNMLMLSAAICWAVSLGAKFVAYGAHGGDHAIYPDCRPEFAEAMDRAARLADWNTVGVISPFIRMTKSDIARRGAQLGVPF